MADGACEDQVQPLSRGRIEGPLNFPTEIEQIRMAVAVVAYDIEQHTRAGTVGIGLQGGWAFTLRSALDPPTPFITLEEVNANLQWARHVEVPSAAPKVVECRLCRAWHLGPACELPAAAR